METSALARQIFARFSEKGGKAPEGLSSVVPFRHIFWNPQVRFFGRIFKLPFKEVILLEFTATYSRMNKLENSFVRNQIDVTAPSSINSPDQSAAKAMHSNTWFDTSIQGEVLGHYFDNSL